ncbi:hypothetical protein ACMDCT_04520 [Halomonadaceae bacterium KBTZ08]
MKMKVMQILLVMAAVLCGIGIAMALTGDGDQSAAPYRPSPLMRSLGGLIGPPALNPDELTGEDRGLAFPSSFRLAEGMEKTFEIASSHSSQRHAVFRISGRSAGLTITYTVASDQRFNGRTVKGRRWRQSKAENPDKVRFVIFDRGGELSFSNTGNRSNDITLRMED